MAERPRRRLPAVHLEGGDTDASDWGPRETKAPEGRARTSRPVEGARR